MLYDEAALVAAAEALGRLVRPGDAILLYGPMGAGKTTFTRALARGLGVTRPERVCSPTFNLLLVHPGATPLVHVDLCRLGELGGDDAPSISSAAFEALGLGELADELASPNATRVIAVEWAELWADPPAVRLELRLARSPLESSSRSGPESAEAAGLRRLDVVPIGPRPTELAQQWRRTGVLRGG